MRIIQLVVEQVNSGVIGCFLINWCMKAFDIPVGESSTPVSPYFLPYFAQAYSKVDLTLLILVFQLLISKNLHIFLSES